MRLKFSLNMICPKRLKLNQFRMVSIPKPKDLFMRIGRRSMPMQDGQVASFSNGVMEDLDNLEAQYLKESQMPPDFPMQ